MAAVIRTRRQRSAPLLSNDLLPPIGRPRRALPPSEQWQIEPMGERRPSGWRPPIQRQARKPRHAAAVPTWLTVATIITTLYAVARYQGYDVTCRLQDGGVYCRAVTPEER